MKSRLSFRNNRNWIFSQCWTTFISILMCLNDGEHHFEWAFWCEEKYINAINKLFIHEQIYILACVVFCSCMNTCNLVFLFCTSWFPKILLLSLIKRLSCHMKAYSLHNGSDSNDTYLQVMNSMDSQSARLNEYPLSFQHVFASTNSQYTMPNQKLYYHPVHHM